MSAARFAVIGQPVSHSKSPRIHAAFARECGVDIEYTAIEVAPKELANQLATLHADGYVGLNVTLPHKAAAVALCAGVSERAQLAGAVNCLIRSDDGWRGDNTDGEGLLRDLSRLGLVVAGARVLVLGAGGAARGIVGPLLAAAPASLTVSGRNPWKPEELAEQFKPVGTVIPRTHLALKGDAYDLIINATSAGHDGGVPRLPPGLLAAGGACYDLSYGAAFEPFAAWARAQGASVVADGLGMLVEQAAASFTLWLGPAPDAEAVLATLRAG